LIEGKDERLGVLSEEPLVLETPHSVRAGQTITPVSILCVRNIQDLPKGLTLAPRPLAGWDVALAGLIDAPVTIHGEA
jgi:hypothetical protein